jgi:hypothetical protein
MMRKKMQKKFLLTFSYIILFSLIIISFDQHKTLFSDDDPDKPHVSLISVKYRGGIITIYFEPLLDVNLRYRIYRSRTLIKDDESLRDATLVSEISKYELPFYDDPQEDGKYNYLITVVEDDIEHIIFIPFQNMNINPVDYSPYPHAVDSIRVSSGTGGSVEIYFTPVKPEDTYLLYKSDKMIDEIDDQELIGTIKGEDGHFSVVLKENTPLYFAITVKNRLNVLNNNVIYGMNMTETPFTYVKTEEPAVKRITNRELIDDNLKSNFYRADYSKALEVFVMILQKKDLTADEKAVVHFYMGQCHYYLGDYRTAIKYFILSKEVSGYRNMSEIWIDRSLAKTRS